jgi:hypothetical protein
MRKRMSVTYLLSATAVAFLIAWGVDAAWGHAAAIVAFVSLIAVANWPERESLRE